VVDILINFAGDVFLAEAVKDYLSSKGFYLRHTYDAQQRRNKHINTRK